NAREGARGRHEPPLHNQIVIGRGPRSFAQPRRQRRPIWNAWEVSGARMTRKRVGVLISGRGSNMESLVEAAKERSYAAALARVVSNNPQAPGLARAEAHAIPTAVIDHRSHGKDRAAFERALETVLEEHRVELICLAGFMRLLT